jgi:hypothetical protein
MLLSFRVTVSKTHSDFCIWIGKFSLFVNNIQDLKLFLGGVFSIFV